MGFFNEYIKIIKNKKKAKRSWKLISDGDLWQHFYNAIEAKGAHSVRITWVKCHATPEHIKCGVTTQENKEGNDEADKIADIGAELHGKDVISLAAKLQSRHNQYAKLMTEITHHIIEAYSIHRELLEQEQQNNNETIKTKYNTTNQNKFKFNVFKYILCNLIKSD